MPLPNGQMPAIARNSVDLPDPEGPASSTRSCGAIVMPSAATCGLPFGSAISSPLRVIPAASAAATLIAGAAASIACALRDRRLEAGEALDHGAPFGERAVHIDEERQRVLHAVEGGCRLRQPAKLKVAGEIRRADEDEREHHRGLIVARGEERQLLRPRHDPQPVGDDGREALQQTVALGLLAAQQRNLLGVLARTDEIEAEVGFIALLAEIERGQRAADQMREQRAGDGIDQRGPDEIAGDRPSGQGQRRRRRQAPQDHHERRE